ncbi:Carboxylesterase 4A [Trichinella zimbabwensis]|uniref:Carboxylesterase 4A n=1 Tax=Trichinella zimbabwensis TaxID=268475 RepID=A0A0V1H566_9BILA|nr:Carboxylesterase 4A [Trichinella zimbabwensis]
MKLAIIFTVFCLITVDSFVIEEVDAFNALMQLLNLKDRTEAEQLITVQSLLKQSTVDAKEILRKILQREADPEILKFVESIEGYILGAAKLHEETEDKMYALLDQQTSHSTKLELIEKILENKHRCENDARQSYPGVHEDFIAAASQRCFSDHIHLQYFLLPSFVIFCAIDKGVSQSKEDDIITIVNLTVGSVEGFEKFTNGSSLGKVFLGIPYAEAPLFNLRFSSPVPKQSWNSTILKCYNYKANCWQSESSQNWTSEDCLYLNIYAGEKCSTSFPCPVVVYIPGKQQLQANLHDMLFTSAILKKFSKENLIFVTVQYRLGVFGFFSTGTPDAPGNYGLEDIIEALRFIKREITAFNGDPSKVTLMGHGGGAVLTSLLTLSPKTEGLFYQAIVMSGTALSPDIFYNYTSDYTLLAFRLGCRAHQSMHNMTNLVECMRKVSANQLNFEYDQIRKGKGELSLEMNIQTINAINETDAILPATSTILKNTRRPIPYLIGTTKNEFQLDLKSLVWQNDPTDINLACKWILTASKKEKKDSKTSMTSCIQYYYFKGIFQATTPGSDFNWTNIVQEMINDYKIFSPVYFDASSMRNSGAPVYLYSFDYQSPNFPEQRPLDIAYLLGLNMHAFDKADLDVQQTFLKMLINFIKFGNPTHERVKNVTWTPLALPNGYNYLSINNDLQVEKYYHYGAVMLWQYKFDNQNKTSALKVVMGNTFKQSNDASSFEKTYLMQPLREDDEKYFTVITPVNVTEPWVIHDTLASRILFWTCVAVAVFILIFGVLLIICLNRAKKYQKQKRRNYISMDSQEKKYTQTAHMYQTF